MLINEIDMNRSFLQRVVGWYGVNTSGVELVENHRRAATVPSLFRKTRSFFLLFACIFLVTSGGVDLYGQTFKVKNGVSVYPTLSAAPTNPVHGTIYFNTTDKILYFFDGSQWHSLFEGASIMSSLKPEVSVATVGSVAIGFQSSGTYTYNADATLGYREGTSRYQWYQADDVSGTNKAAISLATTNKFTPSVSQSGKYITLGVTPVNIYGIAGDERLGTWQLVQRAIPSYSSSTVGGLTSSIAQNGTPVTAVKGTYSTIPSTSDPEGTPDYQWYRATDATGTGKTAIVGQTGSSHTVDIGNDSYGYYSNSYLAVGITPKTVAGTKGSEVLSAWVPVWKCGLDFKVKHTYASGGPVPAASNNGTFTYGTVAVTQNSQPVCWITRNLGATANATLVTDAGSASRGWFWQFNQKQGYSYESTTEAPATRTFSVSSSTNWALANDPCRILLGDTWRVPAKSDWENVLSVSGGTMDNLYTKINLHRVGYLELFESGQKASGVNAHYWSSLVYNSADACALNYYSGSSAVVIGAQKQNYGFPVRCVYLNSDAVAQCIPSATGVSFTGQLTGTYTYVPDNTFNYLEQSSTYQWYQATDALGTGNVAISGATTTSYTIPSGMIGKYLRFGVKPRNIVGYEGVEVFSSWVVLDPVPAYASSSIGNQTSGCAANGTTVTADKGTYSVTPAVSGSEGTPVYQWYWATDATGTGKTAISGQTGSTHTVDASNTSFGYNNYSYLAVGITPKTLGGKTGSEVLSAWAPVWKCGSPYKVKHTYASGGPVPASSNTDSYTYGTVAVTQNSQPVCWITRNLGATADATSVNDAGSTSRGWFWQFNQKQGYSHDGTTETPATRTLTGVSSSTDLLQDNDPCRSLLGNLWHLPTKSEWSSILSANSNADGLYNKVKLHMAGYLERSSKTLSQSGIGGFYWSLNVYDGTSDLAYALNGMSSVGSNYQGYAFPARCVFQTTEQASQSIPSATGVSYNTDRLYTSGVLTGQYTYVPDNTLKYPEQLSTYQWYQATDASGTGNTAISGATTKSYTIPSGMTGKYLRIGVKPRNELGNSGVEIFGSWILVVNPVPSYASVSIGRSIISDTKKTNLTAVKGTYLTTPATTGSEGTPTYQWYRATDASGTGKTAMLGQTAVTHLVDVTNGSYGYNNYSYLAVGITPQPVGDKSGVEKLSSWVPVWQCGETLTVVHTNGDGYSPLTATIAYETVPDNSTCWQGRNLGATEFNTAITNESRGWFYQWNTKQGYYTNGTTVTPTWVDNTNTDQLWATANDPCVQLGSTWHVPNYTEMAGMAGCFTGTRMGDIVNASRINLKMYFLPVGFLDNGSFSSMGMLQMDFWMNGSDVNSTTWQVYDGGQNQYWNLRSSTGSYSIRCCR